MEVLDSKCSEVHIMVATTLNMNFNFAFGDIFLAIYLTVHEKNKHHLCSFHPTQG